MKLVGLQTKNISQALHIYFTIIDLKQNYLIFLMPFVVGGLIKVIPDLIIMFSIYFDAQQYCKKIYTNRYWCLSLPKIETEMCGFEYVVIIL